MSENTFVENQMNPTMAMRKKSRRRKFMRHYFPALLLILVILLGLATVYFYKKSKSGATADARETASLVEKVDKLVVLPSGETPTIATVSDPAALKNQSFFVDAKKGDKVLIYANAKKAFLYDPVAGKVVNMAPINTGDVPTTTPKTDTTKK